MSFPTFNGAAGKDAQEFLDNLEIACLVSGRDDDATRLRVFPLLMKAEAKAWFNTLLPANRGDWAGLRVLFLAKFGGGGETFESLWGKVCELRQGSLFEYNVYELQFVELWEWWVASLRLGEAAPNFFKKDRFVAGLCSPLREKVKGRFPVTWMDARDIVHLKERKIRYQLQQREADQEEEGMASVPPTSAPPTHRGQGNQDQQELLSRITHQLEDLLVHLVQGGRGSPPNQEQARGPRRQAQEYHCYNCNENGHGIYYCPHPRRIVQPQPQQPPPPPSPIAPIPPLPIPEIRYVNVINLDAKVKVEEEEKGKSLPKDKGKAKVEDVDAMPIKRARQEEAAMCETRERRKSKENGENISKKKSKPRQKLTIKDFALGESSQPYNLVDDVSVQGPNITWPQLLHLAPKVRRQWTKMVSTRRVKTNAMGLVSGKEGKDGKHESLDLETSVDEFSSSDYSTLEEESTITDESDSSQAKIMGVVLTNPTMVSSINVPQVEEGRLAKMLAKDLTQEERQAYLAMLEGYPKLFIDGYDRITGVCVVQHHINLKDGAKLVVQRLRRLGVIQQDALLSEVRKLLNAGFIYPIEDLEWVSPVVVTPKKNGKWRVCVDYKPLNAATKRDHLPLPFQDEILNEVVGYERYTVCDGYSGYFQIRIAEEDQKKTTFVTPWGCFAYRVIPFGLTNAPAIFQRFVTHVFQPFFGKSIRVFIDDFCIYSSCVLHLEKVNEGLARLQSLGGQLNVDKCHIAESQLNVDKCHIAESQVTLLGHVVSSRGIEADHGKVQALVSLPSPKSAKELVSFI
ncbi:hypothetical protein L7F22_062870 [Adiantum nelumboides]|nr:hypothetical protein [Adiantum nelumboides]